MKSTLINDFGIAFEYYDHIPARLLFHTCIIVVLGGLTDELTHSEPFDSDFVIAQGIRSRSVGCRGG
jgi:hypothetical protein